MVVFDGVGSGADHFLHFTRQPDHGHAAAADTEKLRDTTVAALKVPLPGWLASTVQVPGETSVSTVPLTVQTCGVADANETVKSDVDVAASAGGAVPSVCAPGELKVMTWVAVNTVKLTVMAGAGANTALPGWLAVMLQVPADTSVSVLPLTVQTAVVVDVKVTAKVDVALATSAGGVLPTVWLPGEAKLMLCAAGRTLKLTSTVAAAAKVALPAWLALRLQVPAATRVKVLPLTEHTPGVVDA